MRHLDLFSGIGGFALAARWVGWETVAFCEIDPYCQKVLAKHWPNVPIYDDIRNLTGEQVGSVDIITGGFPCQDISVAGKQAGIEGERSGLWSELARIISEIRPRFAVMENVAALLSGDFGRWFQRVLGDLAEVGYSCEWHCIPASAVGAPHRRDRIWIIAYPVKHGCYSFRIRSEENKKERREKTGFDNSFCGDVSDANSERQQAGRTFIISGQQKLAAWADAAGGKFWLAEPDVGRVANGVPNRVDRLRALGNAIVPQVAEVIFRAIQAVNGE